MFLEFFVFCFFQPGAVFLAMCCMLKLQSLLLHFGAKIVHLFKCLAHGFWLVPFGFWLWFHLASGFHFLALGFTWCLAFSGF